MKPKHFVNSTDRAMVALESLTIITSTVYDFYKLAPKSCRGVAKVVCRKVFKHASCVRRAVQDLSAYRDRMSGFSMREAGIDEKILEDIPYIFSEKHLPFLIEESAISRRNRSTADVVLTIERTWIASMIKCFPDRAVILLLRRGLPGMNFDRLKTAESLNHPKLRDSALDGRIIYGDGNVVYIVYNFSEGTIGTREGKCEVSDKYKVDFTPLTEPLYIPGPPSSDPKESCLYHDEQRDEENK